MDHEAKRERDEAPTEFVEDRCPGCGAEWVGHAGAFACGHPLADCPVQVDRDEAWRWSEILRTEEEAFASLVVDVCETGSDADVLAMDELEAELDAKIDATQNVDPNEAVWEKVELEPLDIPF